MPYNLPIPQNLLAAGWRAKVFDAEGPEVPHVTIRYKTERGWRVSLRSREFLPPGGTWTEIPEEIKAAIEAHLEEMRAYWDARNPHNPVEGEDDVQDR